MALADLLHAIQAEADEEIAVRRAAVESEAAATLATARAQADEVERELPDAARTVARGEADHRLAMARLQAVHRVRAARKTAYDELQSTLAHDLAGMRSLPAYPTVLRALVDEALAVVPEATELHVDPRDLALATADARPGVAVMADLETSGGVRAVSPTGRSVTNTLEQRLADAEPRLRIHFARALGANTA